MKKIVKLIGVILFGSVSYFSWEGGKIASLEIAITDSYKLMLFGITTGIMGTLDLFLLANLVFSERRSKAKTRE